MEFYRAYIRENPMKARIASGKYRLGKGQGLRFDEESGTEKSGTGVPPVINSGTGVPPVAKGGTGVPPVISRRPSHPPPKQVQRLHGHPRPRRRAPEPPLLHLQEHHPQQPPAAPSVACREPGSPERNRRAEPAEVAEAVDVGAAWLEPLEGTPHAQRPGCVGAPAPHPAPLHGLPGTSPSEAMWPGPVWFRLWGLKAQSRLAGLAWNRRP